MTITITDKEYEAISFALGQLQTEIEAASDEGFLDMAEKATSAIYNVQKKYREARDKAKYFQSIRAEVSRYYRNGGLSTRYIDKMTRQVIKKIKEEKKCEVSL